MFQSIGWILIESWPSVHLPIPGYVNTEREVEHIKDQCKQLTASFQVKSKGKKPESFCEALGSLSLDKLTMTIPSVMPN